MVISCREILNKIVLYNIKILFINIIVIKMI